MPGDHANLDCSSFQRIQTAKTIAKSPGVMRGETFGKLRTGLSNHGRGNKEVLLGHQDERI